MDFKNLITMALGSKIRQNGCRIGNIEKLFCKIFVNIFYYLFLCTSIYGFGK